MLPAMEPPEPVASTAPEPGAPRSPAPPHLLELLAAIRELHAAPDLKNGLARLAERIREHLSYRTFGVLLLDERGRELRFAHALGYPPGVAEQWRFGFGQGIIGSAAAGGRPLRVDDVSADPRYLNAGERIRSELAVPLLAKGRTIGVLTLGHEERGYFTAAHEQLLELLADHLATAIDNAQLHENAREQARTLTLLHEVSRELSSILDRRELLERVAVAIRRLIDYDLFTVLLWDEHRQLLEPWLSVGHDGAPRRGMEPMTLGTGLSGTAALLRQPVRVPNVRLDPRFVDSFPGFAVRSELVVPLVHKDRLLGVLDLESLAYDAFSSHHEQLLSTLSGSLAVALENARHYEQLRVEEGRYRSDLATARQIQRQLLPKTSPLVAGLQIGFAFEPARDLGGDFYDFLSYGDGRLGFAIGDVAGKATAAALYGSFAVGLLREHVAQQRPEPAVVLAQLNQRLRSLGVDGRFLAMAFALYEPRSHRLRLASSGLPFPHLVREGRAITIPAAGVPLGLLADRTYDEHELHLAPGDIVAFTTDGVDECVDEADRELGRERVGAALLALASEPAHEIAQGVLTACRRHGGEREPTDDRTVLVLRRTSG